MKLTTIQTIIIIAVIAMGTMITRFLPFILFKGEKGKNKYIQYFGRVLPYAAIGLLVVYCLKDVSLTTPSYGLPEGIAILIIGILHYWKENTVLSIGAGTVIYMILVQNVFV